MGYIENPIFIEQLKFFVVKGSEFVDYLMDISSSLPWNFLISKNPASELLKDSFYSKYVTFLLPSEKNHRELYVF